MISICNYVIFALDFKIRRGKEMTDDGDMFDHIENILGEKERDLKKVTDKSNTIGVGFSKPSAIWKLWVVDP